MADYFGHRCRDAPGQELLKAGKNRFGKAPVDVLS